MDHVQIDVLPSEATPETMDPHLHSTIEERSKAEKIIARASIPPIMLEKNATVSPGDLELVKIKIDQENHADMDTSEAGPSFGREWGSPKLKENAEIVPAPAPVDTSEAEAEPSRSEPWSRSKLKEPEEIGSTSWDFYKPVSSDTDNIFERFQPETWKIKLYRAVSSGKINLFDEIFSDDTLAEQISPVANGVLHVAVQYKQVRMVEEIMNRVPGLVNSRNMNGDLPLHIAARVGGVPISQFLIERMRAETLEIKNEEGDTALHDAVRGAHLEVVKLLVQANRNLTRIENKIGESPLFLAVDKWHFDIAREIFSQSSECSIRGRDSMNVLHAAIIRLGQGHQLRWFRPIIDILYALLIDPILSSGRLPLIPLMPVFDYYPPGSTIDSKQHRKHFADYVKFVKEVSRVHPSAVSEADKFGLTPFHYAAHYGRLDIFEFLLEADDLIAYQRDKLEGMSAVHIAARNGCVEFIRELIKKFPDAWELLNDKGMTALHVASESGKQNVVDYMLKDHGFEGVINKKDKNGNTPLHLASIQGHHRILVKLADDERVDGSAINNKGFTAVDIVQSSSKFTNSEKAYISFRLNNRGSLLTLKEEVRQMKESEDKPVEIDKAPEEEKDSQWTQSNGNGMYKDDMYVVVATLIASVTFGAALQIPGGYKNEDPGKGSATVIKQLMFNIFVLADCFSFASSSGSIFVHFWASVEKSSTVAKKFRQDARILTNLSIGGMVVAFTAGIHVALGPSPLLRTASFGLCIFFLWGPWLIFNRIAAMIIKKLAAHLAKTR